MKLTDSFLPRLECRTYEYLEKGWTVEKPLYVDWFLRYAIKLRKPTAESIERAQERRAYSIANQFGNDHADPVA